MTLSMPSAGQRIAQLAHVLLKGGRGYIAMLAAYLDASGHSQPSKFIVVAGFVAEVNKWTEFESDWKALLAEPRYALEYAHAKKIAQWKKDKKDQFYLETNYLLKRTVSFAVAATIKHSDYKQAFLNHPYPRDSLYGFACRGAMVAISKHVAESWPGERVAIVLEHGDPNQGGAKKIAELTMEGAKISEELAKQYPVESFTIKFKRDFGALQVADMHAYVKHDLHHKGETRYQNILLSNLNVSHFDLDADDIKSARDSVLENMRKRKEYGMKKYGTRKKR